MPDNINSNTVLKAGLQKVNTANTRAVLNNADTYSFMLAMFNGTLEMASGKPGDIVSGMMSKGFATADVTAKVTGSNAVVITSTMAQIVTQSAMLVKLASVSSPTAAIATIGATFATKTSLAFGLAGGDNKKAACIAAMSDLAAAGLTMTAGVISTGTGVGAGFGVVIIASSVAQITLGAYNTHQACIASQ